ncbi:hypothetical protein BJ878DRAFT_553791 [Calycina marina]|uniref:Uncharacterized protein n=1 Tax=Calycina marina TaxID=1763456 RepID=A0A9P8CDF3_9HELO|nr:hypothetical protein BJ878DRAFT_553791 [Calycina marina]
MIYIFMKMFSGRHADIDQVKMTSNQKLVKNKPVNSVETSFEKINPARKKATKARPVDVDPALASPPQFDTEIQAYVSMIRWKNAPSSKIWTHDSSIGELAELSDISLTKDALTERWKDDRGYARCPIRKLIWRTIEAAAPNLAVAAALPHGDLIILQDTRAPLAGGSDGIDRPVTYSSFARVDTSLRYAKNVRLSPSSRQWVSFN